MAELGGRVGVWDRSSLGLSPGGPDRRSAWQHRLLNIPSVWILIHSVPQLKITPQCSLGTAVRVGSTDLLISLVAQPQFDVGESDDYRMSFLAENPATLCDGLLLENATSPDLYLNS